MYQLLKKDGKAKRGRFTTVLGVVETPVFMNVGTVAAIKGAVSTDDLRGIKTQIELSNTYHLHVRTGVVTYKYKPKKGSHRKQGHRQPYTKVVINAINA